MASARKIGWRQRCEEAAARDDLSPALVQEMATRVFLGVSSELPDGGAHQAAALFESFGSLQIKLREASPADEGGFVRDVAQQLEVLNGGRVNGTEIAWPAPTAKDDDE